MAKTITQIILEAEHSKINDHASGHHFANFQKHNWLGYAGASHLPTGEPPKIHESDHGDVVVSGHAHDGGDKPTHHLVEVTHWDGENNHGSHQQTFKHRHHAMEFAHKAAEILHKHGEAGSHKVGPELEHHGFDRVI